MFKFRDSFIFTILLKGHTEYYSSSKLFFTGNGAYSIVFDGQKISPDTYPSQVGTYISLILQSCSYPVICLMATKMDLAKDGILRRKTKDVSYILDIVKEQIQFFLKMAPSNIEKVFLYDQVLRFSSKKPSKNKLKTVTEIFLSIMSNQNFFKHHAFSVPKTWNSLCSEIKSDKQSEMNISKVEEIFSKVKETNLRENEIQFSEHLLALSQMLSSEKYKSGQEVDKQQQDEDFSRSQFVLTFFSSIGEVLMFPEVEMLRGKVITQPMQFIKDCR